MFAPDPATARNWCELTFQLAREAAEMERDRSYEADGYATAVAWLRGQGIGAGWASKLLALGHQLLRTPELAKLTVAQAEVVAANVPERHATLFSEHAAELIPHWSPLSPRYLRVAMQQWVDRADALSEREPPPEPASELHHSLTIDGRWFTDGAFDGDDGVIVHKAIEVFQPTDFDTPAAERRAQGLVAACKFAIEHHADNLPARNRAHVAVVIDVERVEYAEHGIAVKHARVHEILCDADLTRVVMAGSKPLDLGTTKRLVTPAQRIAMLIRDRGCRWPGCDRPASWCDAHHIEHWRDGGRTDLDNLALLCGKHHRMLHTRGHTLTLDPATATVTVTAADGTKQTSRPPPRRAAA